MFSHPFKKNQQRKWMTYLLWLMFDGLNMIRKAEKKQK